MKTGEELREVCIKAVQIRGSYCCNLKENWKCEHQALSGIYENKRVYLLCNKFYEKEK